MNLRPVEPADLDALVSIFAEPDVAARWWGYDRDRVNREFVEEDDPEITSHVIEVDGEVAGLIQSWEESDPEYRHAGIDIALGARWQGRGLGAAAIRMLIKDLIDQRGHHRFTIDPAVDNERAIACYRKVGFKPVGVMREYEKGPDGTFHDGLLMDLLAREFESADREPRGSAAQEP